MHTLLINPDTSAVTVAEVEGDFLDAVRREIGAPTLVVMANGAARFAVWCDNLGILKPGRAFWRFRDAEHRFAGRCLLSGIDEEGQPCSLPEAATPETVGPNLIFYPPEVLISVTEKIVILPDEQGRPVPAVARLAQWAEDPALPAEPPQVTDLGWSVYEREDGSFRAVQYRLDGEKLEPVAMFSAPTLEEVRTKLPPGLTKVDPADHDNPELVESWT